MSRPDETSRDVKDMFHKFALRIVLSTALLAAGSDALSDEGSWQLKPAMPIARGYQASAVLGGRWFVGGGVSGTSETFSQGIESFPAPVEVFDPTIGHWQSAGQLATGREYLQAIADEQSGTILFVGGFTPAGASSEGDVWDGIGWRQIGLLTPRYAHAASWAAGKFVVTGGADVSGGAVSGAEVLGADDTAWIGEGDMPGGPREWHAMTPLDDGKRVLVVGGCTPSGAISSVDIVDATMEPAGAWSKAADMHEGRCRMPAIRLFDGRILVAGGLSGNRVLGSSEIYDPLIDAWMTVASMNQVRYDHAMTILPDGRVLVMGGTDDADEGELGALASGEIYDPKADRWIPAPPMHDARRWPSVAVLSDGVYVTGGSNAIGTPSSKNPDAMDVGSVQVLATTEMLPFTVLLAQDAGTVGNSGLDVDGSAETRDAGTETTDASDAHQGGDVSNGEVPATETAVGCGCGVANSDGDNVQETGLVLLLVAACMCGRRKDGCESRG